MMQFEFIEGNPGANPKLSLVAQTAVAFKKFRHLQQMPKPLKFWEYRKINALSPEAKVRDLEVVCRETAAQEVWRRYDALKAELSKTE